MKFHLQGSEIIHADSARVFAGLSDPNFMVGTIPDLQSYKILDQEHFEAKIRVGISIVRGTVDMKFQLADKVDGKRAKLIGDGSGAGSKIHIDSSFSLEPNPEGTTKMSWSADVELGGLMAGIGSQMLKSQSEKQVAQIFSNIKKELEASPQ